MAPAMDQINLDPWVPADELRRIVNEAPADPALISDLAAVRDGLVAAVEAQPASN